MLKQCQRAGIVQHVPDGPSCPSCRRRRNERPQRHRQHAGQPDGRAGRDARGGEPCRNQRYRIRHPYTQHLQQLFNYLMREKKHLPPSYPYNCCLKNRKPQHEKKPEPNLIKSSSSLEISGIPAKLRCLCARNRNEIYLKVPFPESPTTTTTTPPMIGRPPTRQFPKLFGIEEAVPAQKPPQKRRLKQ